MRRLLILLFALLGLSTAGCQSMDRGAAPGGPGVMGVQDCPTDGSQCNCGSNKCRIKVSIANCSTGTATVLSDPIRVANGNQHVMLVWSVDPPSGNNWEFVQGNGVYLKDPASDPSGQMYEKCAAAQNDNCDPSARSSKKYHWKDVNVTPAGGNRSFDYKIQLIDTSNPSNKCIVDPQIFNDG
jgi:hypothetical protein